MSSLPMAYCAPVWKPDFINPRGRGRDKEGISGWGPPNPHTRPTEIYPVKIYHFVQNSRKYLHFNKQPKPGATRQEVRVAPFTSRVRTLSRKLIPPAFYFDGAFLRDVDLRSAGETRHLRNTNPRKGGAREKNRKWER